MRLGAQRLHMIAVAKNGAERALTEVNCLRLIGDVDLSRQVGVVGGRVSA